MSKGTQKGFTILEMIMVVAIIALISIVSAPLGLQFSNGQTINGIQGQIGDSLTRARSQAVAQKNDSQFGVCVNITSGFTTSFVLYQGASGPACSTHNTPYDETYQVLSNTTITFPGSAAEINFAKHTGTPSVTGTTTISWNGLTRTVTVDSLGSVVEN